MNFDISNFLHVSPSLQKILFHPTWDIVLVFFLVAALFLYTIATGKGRIISILLAVYISFALSQFLFSHTTLWGFSIPGGSLEKLLIFGALVVLITLIFFRLRLPGARDLSWWNAFILSILGAGLLTMTSYTFLSSEEIKLLSPLTLSFIGTPDMQMAWFVGPLAWLLFLGFLSRE